MANQSLTAKSSTFPRENMTQMYSLLESNLSQACHDWVTIQSDEGSNRRSIATTVSRAKGPSLVWICFLWKRAGHANLSKKDFCKWKPNRNETGSGLIGVRVSL
jgi:hypothetical protein